jgi:ABC-type nitrate/sulfonate/bicarbonate transport system permease component
MKRRLIDVFAPIALIVLLLAAWQAAADWDVLADLLGLEPFLVPSPTDVAKALGENFDLLAHDAWVTMREVLLGFAVALVIGIAFAVLLHLWPLLRRAFYPVIIATQTVPVIVVAPILIVWFGFGIGPKVAIVALICFFPITVNMLDGLGSVPAGQRKLLHSMGAGRRQILTRLEIPASLPYLVSGAKIAIAVAVIGAVFGEWAGSDDGLGHLMLIDNAQLEVPRLFAAIFVLSLMAAALFGIVALLARRLGWWRRGDGHGG